MIIRRQDFNHDHAARAHLLIVHAVFEILHDDHALLPAHGIQAARAVNVESGHDIARHHAVVGREAVLRGRDLVVVMKLHKDAAQLDLGRAAIRPVHPVRATGRGRFHDIGGIDFRAVGELPLDHHLAANRRIHGSGRWFEERVARRRNQRGIRHGGPDDRGAGGEHRRIQRLAEIGVGREMFDVLSEDGGTQQQVRRAQIVCRAHAPGIATRHDRHRLQVRIAIEKRQLRGKPNGIISRHRLRLHGASSQQNQSKPPCDPDAE